MSRNPVDLEKAWKSLRNVSEEVRAISSATYQPKVEDRAFVEAQDHYQNKISTAASDFLRANGYLASGRSKRKIPGL